MDIIGVWSDFDCKVVDYMSRLEREDAVRSTVARTQTDRPV